MGHSFYSSDCVCLPKTKLNERERERGKDTPKATMATRGAAAAPNCCVLLLKSRGGLGVGKKRLLDFSTSSLVRDRPRDHHHHHHHHRIQSCNDFVECSTSGGGGGGGVNDERGDEKKTMEEKNFENDLEEASFTARHNT